MFLLLGLVLTRGLIKTSKENKIMPEPNVYLGQYVYVSGTLYYTSYAEYGEERGKVNGYYYVKKIVDGRAAPVCISKDGYGYTGWVRLSSISY